MRNCRILCFLLLAIIGVPATAQFQYHFNQDVVVINDVDSLLMPWAGGLNTAQYNVIDLNLDGVGDLMIFNRDNNKVLTFIREGDRYRYSPEFEHLFPGDLEHWVLLRDYNCDGKVDLFTSSIFGMSLYENVSSGDQLEWLLIHETIFTEGSNGQTNLQVSSIDLPGIVDVDGDGDIDILAFNFASGGGVHFHKNMSVERTGTCGLDLVRTSKRYGDFEECTCDDYIFGSDICSTGGRVQHSGGKSINSFPYSGPTLQDLVIGQEECTSCGYLKNEGTVAEAKMTSVDFDFPNSTNPITLSYPAIFNIDVDFDGLQDILVANNAFDVHDGGEYDKSNWHYKNNGGSFTLITTGFLQEKMIDVGFAAIPTFSDINNDGDEDLFIGSGNQGGGATLSFYENAGDALTPQLLKSDNDYLKLSSNNYSSIKPQSVDLNSNGLEDLIIIYGEASQQLCDIYWHTGNQLVPFENNNKLALNIPALDLRDRPYFYYTGGKLALLVGRETGRLSKFINQGTIENPIWELVTDSFLGLEDDFRARNLSVFINDMDGDGKEDLVSYDDSGSLRIYSDYKNEASIVNDIIQDKESLMSYNSSFGTNVSIVPSNLTGSILPSISIGLKTGGLQLLTNVKDEQQDIDLAINIDIFPNPALDKDYIKLVANQNLTFKIIDSMGKEVRTIESLIKGEIHHLSIGSLTSGLYLIQATNNIGLTTTSRFVVVR